MVQITPGKQGARIHAFTGSHVMPSPTCPQKCVHMQRRRRWPWHARARARTIPEGHAPQAKPASELGAAVQVTPGKHALAQVEAASY